MSAIWSKSRFRRFQACRREYFLHYFTANAKHAVPDSAEFAEVWQLKQLVPLEWYFYRLFRQTLHNVWQNGRVGAESPYAVLHRELWRQWSVDRINHQAEFQEVYYGEITLPAAMQIGEALLTQYLKTFKHSELAKFIGKNHQVLPLALPLSFPLNGTQIYLSPWGASYAEDGYRLSFLSGVDNPLDAVLGQFYLLMQFGAAPDKTTVDFYDLHTGNRRICPPEELNFTAAVERIELESLQMTAEIPPDIIASQAYFALAKHPEHCAACRFRQLCQTR